MPELPEVETTASDLRTQLVGQRITAVNILWPRTVAAPDAAALANGVTDRAILSIRRRGKYLLIGLDSGDTLVIHLRMTGRLQVVPDGSAALADPHVRVWFDLASKEHFVFADARKFGRVWLTSDIEQVVGRLGPEPLDWTFTPELLTERVRPRRVAIKSLLLDQTVIAGLGNIYADEALFMASIHPLRSGASLTDAELVALHDAIRQVLADAIRFRGTMLRDYRPPYGEAGAYRNHLRVYQQTGQPCPRCGAAVQRIRVTQRSTHFCAQCQPAARPAG